MGGRSRQTLALALCGCGPLCGLILFILFVRWSFSGLVGASPSPPLWLWAPLGADFVHFAGAGLFLGAGGSLALALPVVVGPFGG